MKRTSLRTDGPRFLLWFIATTTQLLKIYGLKKKKNTSNRPKSSHGNPTVSDILYILPHACKVKKKQKQNKNKQKQKSNNNKRLQKDQS